MTVGIAFSEGSILLLKHPALRRGQLGRCVSFSSQMNLEADNDNVEGMYYHAVHSRSFSSLQEETATDYQIEGNRPSLPIQSSEGERRGSPHQLYTRIQTQLFPHIDF